MCGHWLCQAGGSSICFFVPDQTKMPIGSARELSDLEWDLLDELHDAIVADPTSRRAIGILGVQIETYVRRVFHIDRELGDKCRDAMAERYAACPDAANPRLARKVVLHRSDDALEAAQKLRSLGDDFVARVMAVLDHDD